MTDVLDVRELSRIYRSGDRDLTVLHGVTFRVAAGTTCAIVGPSGSGKTTLLGLCAGLDRASDGSVILDGQPLEGLDEDERALLRRDLVGFVFQNFQLVPTLSAVENVSVPLELRGESGARDRAAELLTRVGLGDRLDHYPVQLSGGEQQRVGLARAFIHRPKILFADEPTGNLDADTGGAVEDLLFDLNRETGTTLVLVTHDVDLAGRCGRVIRLRAGAVIEDRTTGDHAT
ncbi:MAG TPA: ABC transporter ATP-binding protein [Candidatus Latescibacteria bacterium]|jgi:putative ABC transport system ATP-binding protein|nr:ABC transporter [Gemmatimonadaceae bacterium]MDP6016335.1 ABC transporter ATP-binding protein [Candidatus Latescibacterota bacterium]HJP29634.1 ABC transporter ATP-binding protein [Candidatus Latescibacterota bacterium]